LEISWEIIIDNKGLNNFVPLGLDLDSKTVPQLGCFLLESIFDIVPDQVQPTIAGNFDLFFGFLKGVLFPSLSMMGSLIVLRLSL